MFTDTDDFSGEATICILQWYEQAVQAHKPTSPKHDSISTIRPPIMRPIKAQTQTKPQTVLIVNMPKPTILAADPVCLYNVNMSIIF